MAAPGVLGNDTDPDGDPLTAILAAAPSHGDLTFNADGSFTYIPARDFKGQTPLPTRRPMALTTALQHR